ncbi:hypothetical protein DNF23_33870 [Pseudomonas syringae pv. pisi]
MPIQAAHLPTLYVTARDAFHRRLKNADAIRAISSHAGIPASTAGDLVRNLKHMLRGERYRRRLASPITEFFLQAIHQEFGEEGLNNAVNALAAHIEYYEAVSGTNSLTDRAIHTRFDSSQRMKKGRSSERLPAEVLARVTPEHIWLAVQGLVQGELSQGPFGDSTEFDLIAEGGQRLPPKAVFGIALGVALGTVVEPKHFSGGEDSPCFRALRAAGYEVIPKTGVEAGSTAEPEWREWDEGRKVLRSHLAGERAPSLAKAKKAQFRRLHGGLRCEQCGLVPSQHYATELADSCIEVHHAKTQVSEMGQGHKTRLEDLQCLCANCHRLTHRKMREALAPR